MSGPLSEVLNEILGPQGLILMRMSICVPLVCLSVCNLEESKVTQSNKPRSAALNRPLDYNRKSLSKNRRKGKEV